MTQSPTYCKLSHVSVAVQNKGDCCVCNKNQASFGGEETGIPLYLDEVGLQAMWDHPSRKSIAARLDAGEQVESCNACWQDERAGLQSSRQMFNERLADLEPLAEQPRILILKPSNVCNLSCRMCQPATSSSLYKDFYQLETQQETFSGTFKEYTLQFETIRNGFGRDNLLLWDTFERWLPGIVFLDIYGGEPMLAPPMWERMIQVANQGLGKDTVVQMHTNGTIWNQDYIDCLPKFKKVNIGISIDAHDPGQLGYIRRGADAEKLMTNLKKYIELAKTHENVVVWICCTVSIFNVWYVDEIVKGLEEHGIFVGLNYVYTPEHYDLRHLPQAVKQQLLDKFTNLPEEQQVKLEKVIKLLKNQIPGCNIEFPKFWRELQTLDAIRDEKFADVMPEYYQALITAEPWLLD